MINHIFEITFCIAAIATMIGSVFTGYVAAVDPSTACKPKLGRYLFYFLDVALVIIVWGFCCAVLAYSLDKLGVL